MSTFATLDFERRLPLPRALLWEAWSAPAARAIWSAPGPGVSVETLRAEGHVGGLEIAVCRVAGAPDTEVESRWLELDPPRRTTNSEVLRRSGETLSSALVTANLADAAGGSALRLTVQLSAAAPGMEAEYRAGFEGGLDHLVRVTARLMVITREIKAPVAALWQAWTEPASLQSWWGPEGFTCRTQRIDLRAGGDWVFDMIGPDGTVYPNHHRYLQMQPEKLISYSLLWGENGPKHADAWARFDEGPAASRVTLGMIFASEEECRTAKGLGAETLGLQTLGKLARGVGAD